MKRMLTVLAGAAAAMLIATIAWLGFVYSGFYDVAASREHSALTEWTLETISERSIKRRAGELPAPLPTDSSSLLHGLEHYRAMCQVCHGAPGLERNEMAAGLSPRPPRLVHAAAEWTDAELFWIVKHGIRLAGMPAFGPTHSDEDLWAIVAFTRSLADMSEEQYARLVGVPSDGMGGGGEQGGGHSHAPGTASHSH